MPNNTYLLGADPLAQIAFGDFRHTRSFGVRNPEAAADDVGDTRIPASLGWGQEGGARVMGLFMGFFKALLGICETPPLDAELWTLEGGEVMIRLGAAAVLTPVGGAARLQGKGLVSPVLVVHAGDDEYLAFENRCTHHGRKLDPVEEKREIRCCSIGHARFDYEGNKLSGPAKGPVKKYSVEKRGEELIVTLDRGS